MSEDKYYYIARALLGEPIMGVTPDNEYTSNKAHWRVFTKEEVWHYRDRTFVAGEPVPVSYFEKQEATND